MLKKSIVINLALAILTLFFSTAGAMEKGNYTMGSLASLSQTSHKILDLFSKNDEAFSRIIDELYKKNLIAMPPEEFKLTMLSYLQEISAADVGDGLDVIAPGCLTPYTIAALSLFAWVPTTFIVFLDELNNDNDCAFMYGSWCVMGVGFALTSWTSYRICAVENMENPDQSILAKLESDRAAMVSLTGVSFLVGFGYSSECDTRILFEDFND